MAAKNDRDREDAEETAVEEVDPSIVVMVPLPKEAVAQIDTLAAHRRGGSTRADVLERLLRKGLDAEEQADAEDQIANGVTA